MTCTEYRSMTEPTPHLILAHLRHYLECDACAAWFNEQSKISGPPTSKALGEAMSMMPAIERLVCHDQESPLTLADFARLEREGKL
jgi:hypothetical protein